MRTVPTIAELTGNPVPEGLDGLSILPLLENLRRQGLSGL